MDTLKIIIPIENEDEEKLLKKAGESNTLDVAIGNTRNFDGTIVSEIVGQIDHIITFAGSIASLYAVFVNRKVQVVDKSGVIKRNIKIKDLHTFLKSLIYK